MLMHRELTEKIIGAAIEVHRALGPGLLESTYQLCLCEELRSLGIRWDREIYLPIKYKNITIQDAYRMDIIVEDAVVIEVKAVEKLNPIHEAQLLTYLRHSGYRVGFLINFNVALLTDGLVRIAN